MGRAPYIGLVIPQGLGFFFAVMTGLVRPDARCG